MNALAPHAARTRSRLKLILLAALFFGPLAAAFVLYYGLPSWRPSLSTARGELISPARPLPAVSLVDARGAAVPADFLVNHWSFVWVGPGDCASDCVRSLAATRVVRELLSHDALRVQRVFLYSGAPPAAGATEASAEDLHVVSIDGAQGSALLATFPAPAEGRIYIVDPHANLMMRYAGGDIRRDLLEDIKRLLKYSHIG